MKIYGPPNWSFRTPFIGVYHYIRAEDIVEGDPTRRLALVPNRNMASGVLACEAVFEPHLNTDEEIEEEDNNEAQEANEAHNEAHNEDDYEVDDKEWYTDDDGRGLYQDAQDPNDFEDFQNEDSDLPSPRIPRQYLNDI